MMSPHVLDVRGLKCPLPVLKVRKALSSIQVGGRLELLADDPLATIDVPHYCHESGHTLVSQTSDEGAMRFVIEKS